MRNTDRSLAHSSVLTAAILVSAACGVDVDHDLVGHGLRAGQDDVVVADDGDSDGVVGLSLQPRHSTGGCVLTRGGRLERLRASAFGIAALSVGDDSGLTLLAGHGCDLTQQPDGSASGFLDIDDRGAVYHANDGYWTTTTRTQLDGSSDIIVSAGRGIWTFGVSADGGRFYSSACGPTGIFATDDQTHAPVLPMPTHGGWHNAGGVLAGDVFFSLGDDGALVRTDHSGDSIVDGVHTSGATLHRCGNADCLAFADHVVIVEADGSSVLVDRDTLGLADDDVIDSVAAQYADIGLYVLVAHDDVSEIHYVAFQHSPR